MENNQTVVAVTNEKGGTAKTTTAVSLSAALGERGKKVLLVDLDGQAAASRWLGVEDDDRLADAMRRGGGLSVIPDVLPGVSLIPASGKLDAVAHELRPTQGGQLRKVLSKLGGFDFTFIDCPPSLGNRLIGNALLAATHVIVPVETSILALDGLNILLTTLEDIREGFDRRIILGGVLACRYDGRTRLSGLVLEELKRALPGKVFSTVIRENVRMRECPASCQSIMRFAPDSNAAKDYMALAEEILASPEQWRPPTATWGRSATRVQQAAVDDLRRRAAASVRESARKAGYARPGESGSAQEAESVQDQDPSAKVAPTGPDRDVDLAVGARSEEIFAELEGLARAKRRIEHAEQSDKPAAGADDAPSPDRADRPEGSPEQSAVPGLEYRLDTESHSPGEEAARPGHGGKETSGPGSLPEPQTAKPHWMAGGKEQPASAAPPSPAAPVPANGPPPQAKPPEPRDALRRPEGPGKPPAAAQGPSGPAAAGPRLGPAAPPPPKPNAPGDDAAGDPSRPTYVPGPFARPAAAAGTTPPRAAKDEPPAKPPEADGSPQPPPAPAEPTPPVEASPDAADTDEASADEKYPALRAYLRKLEAEGKLPQADKPDKPGNSGKQDQKDNKPADRKPLFRRIFESK